MYWPTFSYNISEIVMRMQNLVPEGFYNSMWGGSRGHGEWFWLNILEKVKQVSLRIPEILLPGTSMLILLGRMSPDPHPEECLWHSVVQIPFFENLYVPC